MADMERTVWVTDRALDLGIRECTAWVSDSPSIVVDIPIKLYGADAVHFHVVDTPDWHLTREAALTRAHHLRDAKVQSLEREVERLRGMRFG